MNKSLAYWLCQIIGWSAYGFAQLALLALAERVNLVLIFGEVIQVILFITLSHLWRVFMIGLKWLNLSWTSLIPRVLLGSLILSLIHFGLLTWSNQFLGTLRVARDLNWGFILATTLISFTLFFFWSLIYLSFHFFDRYNTSLKQEALLREVQLSNLRSQLNPHFIFNALNSIRALVDENPAKSKQAINQLSNTLRNSLKTDDKRLVSFEQELAVLKDYLSLEAIRYEERLDVKMNLDPKSNEFDIPPLMLQTLVENGMKHGISQLPEGGYLKIETMVEETNMRIQISNTGKLKKEKSVSGYGLENTRKRLDLIFGKAASFQIYQQGETVISELIIPKVI